MPIDSDGRWRPNTSRKQDELRELCRQKKFVLCNGPRFSGKTVGALHCVAEHAWLTNPGNISIITISQTVGLDSGVWRDLTDHILAEWIGHKSSGEPWEGRDPYGNPVTGGDFGMEWVKAPFIQGVSKKPTCVVSNAAGGTTTIQLDSLQNEQEVEDRFKPRRYSMIYVPELSTFQSRNTFDTWTECLRMIGLPEASHLFLADSNPPDDSSWWMHDLWWDLLECPNDDESIAAYLDEHRMRMTTEEAKVLKFALARIDITVPDNPFADPRHVALLRAKYAHNDELHRRYILGECVRTTSDSLFAEVFRPTFHVVGEVETPMNPEPEMMFPEEDCFELMTTWDPGSSTNWAAYIVEKFFAKGPDAERYRNLPLFKVLDEVAVIGEDVDAWAFVQKMVEKMKFWESEIGRPVRWPRHWSDASVFSMRDIETKKYYSQVIYEFSEGEITLVGAAKNAGSVRTGLDLIRRLLWEERLFINNACCPTLITALKAAKRGKSELSPIAKGSVHKHPIDALRYLLVSECGDELDKMLMLNLRRRREEKRAGKSGLIRVPL